MGKLVKKKEKGITFKNHSEEEKALIIQDVCMGVSLGKTVKKTLAENPDYPTKMTFYRWLAKDKRAQEEYRFAQGVRAHEIIEEVIQVSRDSSGDCYKDEDGNIILDNNGKPIFNPVNVQRARVITDTLKWAAAKFHDMYGDKPAVEVNVNKIDSIAVQIIEPDK